MLKSLMSDNFMKGLIYQLEESKAHRYQHQIKLLKSYLSWKDQQSTINNRRVSLPNVSHTNFSYTKSEIQQFRTHCWHNLLDLDKPQTSTLKDIKSLEISKILFPRHSRRKTDTQVLSLIHGHDIIFRKFKFNIKKNCSPYCEICYNNYDDNYHRLLVCPKYNSMYRDNIHTVLNDNETEDPILTILSNGKPEVLSDFRTMAQIALEKKCINT